MLWIALAGPAASLVGVVLSGALLGAVDSGGVLHGLLWAATAVGIICVLNLIPFELQDRKDGPVMRSDGWLALDALRVLRALG